MKAGSIALISRILLIALIIIGVILWILVLNGGDANVGPMLNMGYIVFFAGVALAILSFLFGIAINPASLKKVGIGLVIVAVIFGLSYVLADGSDYMNYKDTDERTSKLVSTGLNAFYIVALLAVLSVVYSGVARLFK
jgi:hypothetical protein